MTDQATSQIVQLLAAELPGEIIYDQPSDTMTAPSLIVSPGDPWAAALTFGTWEAAIEVAVVSSRVPGDVHSLWNRAIGVARVLRNVGFSEVNVGPPGLLTVGAIEYLSAVVSCRVVLQED